MSALADLRQVLEEVQAGTNSISEVIEALDRAEKEQRVERRHAEA